MGKVHCEACKKSCKGQAIRLSDKYFHIKCFKCKECNKQLGAAGFYSRDDAYYCGEDYQKLFGTKCSACGQFVEGEVVTALGNTYHQSCFHCTKCNNRFGAGDKVTFTGKDYLCGRCLEAANAVRAAGDPVGNNKPMASSTPAKPGAVPAQQQQQQTNGDLTTPLSDMSHILTDKENLVNGTALEMLHSPHSTLSGYKSDIDSERLHDVSRDSRDSSVFDDCYLNIPVRRKTADSGYMPSVSESCMDSVFDDTDTEKQDRLSPMENIMQYRSPSPSQSTVSRKSRDSTASVGSRHEVDYGKFYNASYLEKPMGVAKGPSINPKERKPTHFHRPENFSYSQVRKDFIRPMKKESSSMMSALGDATHVTRKRLEDFQESPMKNKEVIAMAKFPDSHRRSEDEPLPIEREDWPAPAAAAAAFPELLYKHTSPGLRRSRGESSDMDTTDGGGSSRSQDVTLDDDEIEVDPRIQKDIDHLSRLESESGAAKVILEDLKKKAMEPPPLIDVISASRTPNADKIPHYKTRYESHVFASPSRDLEQHPRTYSVDDQLLGRKYRNALQSVGNYPVDRRHWERPVSMGGLRKPAMKPGYTLRAPKIAHMPSTYASARANGYFSDIEQCVTRDSDFEDSIVHHSGGGGERRAVSKTPSLYTSQSSIEEYDPHTGLRRGGKLRGSSLSSDYSKMVFRTSLFKDEPKTLYSYDELKLSNPARPPGTDINSLEVHLEDVEFETVFQMKRDDFYRLAEWKRNDMKKRVLLY